MNKKTYISPELVIEDVELETMLNGTSYLEGNGRKGPGAHNDDTFEEELGY